MEEKVYISGPITGTDNFVERFAMAEWMLRQKGYTVMNPASAARLSEMPPATTAWEEYMGDDLKMIATADAIYLLKGWENSRGAKIEYNVAVGMGKQIMHEEMERSCKTCGIPNKGGDEACCGCEDDPYRMNWIPERQVERKKVFISQVMKGLTDEEILAVRDKAAKAIEQLVGPVVILDSLVLEDPPKGTNEGLWYLSRSIATLSDADIAYFCVGWEKARGCKIEHTCAVEYGVEVICEEGKNG